MLCEAPWVDRNDNEFKFHLDRYKYPNRYDDVNSLTHRALAESYLDDLDDVIGSGISTALNDALFPLLGSLPIMIGNGLAHQSWTNIHDWLVQNLDSMNSLCA